jgi:hypothetical protein
MTLTRQKAMSMTPLKLAHLVGQIDPRAIIGPAIAIALLLILAVAIGRTYFGHASSPYGVCYGKSGRAIPCAVAGEN